MMPSDFSIDLVGELAILDSRHQHLRAQRFNRMPVDSRPPEVLLFGENPLQPGLQIFEEESYRDSVLRKTVLMRTAFCIIRVLFLFMFYSLDHSVVNSFLVPVIFVLMIHESIVLLNFIVFTVATLIKRDRISNEGVFPNMETGINSPLIKKGCNFADMFANALFFCWFLWGNYRFLFLKDDVVSSLATNKFLTYYITILILVGYFTYSKLIFGMVFFAIFGPCILFVIIDDYLNKQRQINRVQKVKESLEEEEYESYCARNRVQVDSCIICTSEFKSSDRVSGLRCSEKHCFHTDCIRQWVEHRLKCPLCRADLDPEHLSDTQSRYSNISI